MKKNILLLLSTLVLASCGGGGSKPTCSSQDQCLNDKNCQCWCSVKCGYRSKTAKDNPIYIENDPNGKFCYCAQRDIDLYENCTGDHPPATEMPTEQQQQQY